MLRLQQTIGNRAVQRLIQAQRSSSDPTNERQQEVHGVPSVTSIINDTLSSQGRPLDAETRSFMESRFDFDFGQVQVHADSDAAQSAETINANAYTIGPHIVFGEGEYSPASSEGQELIAHELTHIVQQAQGPVAGTPIGAGELSVSDPLDEFERAADTTAHRVLESATHGSTELEQAEGKKEGAAELAGGAGTLSQSKGIQRQGPDDLPVQVPVNPVVPGDPGNVNPFGDTEPPFNPVGPTPVQPGPELPPGYIPGPPKVPNIPEPPPGGFPELPPSPASPLGGAGAEAVGEGGAEAAAGLGAEAILPVAAAGAAGVLAGTGMAELADSSLTKTGAFGTNAATGQNQSAMDWGAGWGTSVDKALGNTEPSILGGLAAGAGGIVGGIGGAGYGAYNWLKNQL
jgi:hypothetical protein